MKTGITLGEAFDVFRIYVKIRNSCLFDRNYYLRENPDVKKNGIDPTLHFILHGAAERRNPSPFFDTSFYLDSNPKSLNSNLNPLYHFITTWAVNRCNPHPLFNTTAYLKRHPELILQNVNPLAHYIRHTSDAAATAVSLLTGSDRLEDASFSLCFAKIKDILGTLHEYEDVIKPLTTIVRNTYRQILFREVTPVELIRHLRHCFGTLKTYDERLTVVNDGNMLPHLNIRPLKLEIDIVNQCNLRCIMCHFSGSKYSGLEKKEMSPSDFRGIAEDIFPLCSQVSLSLSTEPTMSSRFESILRIIGKFGVPFIYMSTNGILLDEQMIGAIIKSGMHQLTISVDGARKTTYETIRRGARFDRLIENIITINRLKEKAGSETPILTFTMVLMRSNIEELPDVLRLASELNVHTLSTVHLVPLSSAHVESKEESLYHHMALFNRMRETALKLADRLRILLTIPDSFTIGKTPGNAGKTCNYHLDLSELPLHQRKHMAPHCFFPWHFVGIEANGDVLPCGWWYHQPPLGNVFETPFETIWKNSAFAKLRSELGQGTLRSVCKNCPSAGCGNVDTSTAFKER